MTFTDIKLVLELKGGPGSGHRGHVGRPGKVGGSVSGTGGVGHLSEEDKLRWSQSINIELYDKFNNVEHGDELLRRVEQIPYTTRDNFVQMFNETEEVPEKAMRNKNFPDEGHMLYSVAKYVKDNPGATAIEVRTLSKYSGVPYRELVRGPLYHSDKGIMKYFRYETRGDLDQLRIRSLHYSFDSKNGVVTNTQALQKAMRKLRYKSPEDLYDKVLKYIP